jgi:hypothetical protein
MQEAVSLLIRLPDHNRENEAALDGFVRQFDLTTEEKSKVLALAQDHNLAKYGRSMRGVRWEKIQHAMPLADRFIDSEALDYLRERLWEPKATKLRFQQISIDFLEFLLTDSEARQILVERAAPFVFDLVKFERAKLGLYLKAAEASAPTGLLAHDSFTLLHLEYDVLAVVAATTEGHFHADPEQREVRLLMLLPPGSEKVRFFEIDEETESFLEGQRHAPRETEAFPASYATLVDIGLCKNLN